MMNSSQRSPWQNGSGSDASPGTSSGARSSRRPPAPRMAYASTVTPEVLFVRARLRHGHQRLEREPGEQLRVRREVLARRNPSSLEHRPHRFRPALRPAFRSCRRTEGARERVVLRTGPLARPHRPAHTLQRSPRRFGDRLLGQYTVYLLLQSVGAIDSDAIGA